MANPVNLLPEFSCPVAGRAHQRTPDGSLFLGPVVAVQDLLPASAQGIVVPKLLPGQGKISIHALLTESDHGPYAHSVGGYTNSIAYTNRKIVARGP